MKVSGIILELPVIRRCRLSSVVLFSGGKAVGSSKAGLNERAFKLLMSALKMVVEGPRSLRNWVEHLNAYLYGESRYLTSNANDDDWRYANDLLADCMKMASVCQSNTQAWVDHLQTFVFGQLRKALVNYDDTAYRRLGRGQHIYVAGGLLPKHFPVRSSGQAEVIYDYLEFNHEPTTEEVVRTVEGRNDIRFPDFAETMTYHETYPQERQEDPVVSFCGANECMDGGRSVPDVHADEDGLYLRWGWLTSSWLQRCRFLVVHIKPAGQAGGKGK